MYEDVPGSDLAGVLERIVCPECHAGLGRGSDRLLRCSGCGIEYPMVGSVPVLLPPGSAFVAKDVADGSKPYFRESSARDDRMRRIRQRLPGLAYDQFIESQDRFVRGLLSEGAAGVVIGAGRRVAEYRRRFPSVRWLATDVEPSMGADVVGDVLSLPLPDSSQDVVVAEHVLEHVVDPLRAAAEIERVLRPGGIVFAKVPFTYPWHGGYVDFFRFTPAGVLAAFSACEALYFGHGPGPMSAVAYTLQSVWVSLFKRRRTIWVASAVGRLTFGWLRYLDRWATLRSGSLGVTMIIVFVGRRVESRRTAAETIAEARRLGAAPLDRI